MRCSGFGRFSVFVRGALLEFRWDTKPRRLAWAPGCQMVRQIPCVPCICRALHLNEVGDDIYTQTDGRTGRPENVRPSWTELICLYGIVQGGKKGSPTRGVLVCVCVDASVSLWCFAGKMRSVYLWLRATSPPPPLASTVKEGIGWLFQSSLHFANYSLCRGRDGALMCARRCFWFGWWKRFV